MVNNFESFAVIVHMYANQLQKILGGNSSISGKILTLQNKSSELWLVHNPKPHVEVYLKN